ncbi:MAG TPA: STAS domain-containing protein [Terriglobales bacterium]|nr:STAS domain-containing protein [Terriglobales bacterium]
MQSPSTLIIKLPLRFGAKEANTLRQELKQQLSDGASVVFDLSQVQQLDIAGIEAIRKCMAQVARQDGSIQLGKISPEAQTILELTRMDRIFNMFPRFSDDTTTYEAGSSREAVEEEIAGVQSAIGTQALVA